MTIKREAASPDATSRFSFIFLNSTNYVSFHMQYTDTLHDTYEGFMFHSCIIHM
jgi:hypothetical protein